MDASALSAVKSAGYAAQAQQDASVGVLRQSLDAESAVALELIQAAVIPGLGENLDAKA
jgi:hypothetical protein